jgi:hypothetical protein
MIRNSGLNPPRILILILTLVISACSTSTPPLLVPSVIAPIVPTPTVPPPLVQALVSPTLAPTLPPTFTPTFIPAGATRTLVPTVSPLPFPTRTETPTPGPSPTPSVPTAFSPDGKAVACHSGPAREYNPNVTLAFNKSSEIVGVDAERHWWYVKVQLASGNYVTCWVQDKTVVTGGDLAAVPVTEFAPAQVTAVNIILDGDYTRAINCSNTDDKITFHFKGEIVADGPVEKLRYLWETNAGPKYQPETNRVRAWNEPRTTRLDLALPAREGTYSLTLRTIFPNEIVWVVQFVVKCQ